MTKFELPDYMIEDYQKHGIGSIRLSNLPNVNSIEIDISDFNREITPNVHLKHLDGATKFSETGPNFCYHRRKLDSGRQSGLIFTLNQPDLKENSGRTYISLEDHKTLQIEITRTVHSTIYQLNPKK